MPPQRQLNTGYAYIALVCHFYTGADIHRREQQGMPYLQSVSNRFGFGYGSLQIKGHSPCLGHFESKDMVLVCKTMDATSIHVHVHFVGLSSGGGGGGLGWRDGFEGS